MTHRIVRRLRNGNLTTDDIKALDSTVEKVELFDAHVLAFSSNLMDKILGGKTIHQHKMEHIEYEKQRREHFHEMYPKVGERVVFRSINFTTNVVYSGYGVVVAVNIKDSRSPMHVIPLCVLHDRI